MTQEEQKMVRDILDTESMGYACVYPLDRGEQKEYMLSLTPENLASFIGAYGLEADKIVITDALDRLVVNTQMWFLDTCPDQQLRRELLAALAPIQMGEWKASKPLAISRETADEYFREEDQMVTMAELRML